MKVKLKIFFLISILILLSNKSDSQSLSKDTFRLAQLDRLIEETTNDSVWPKYNEEMLQLSQRLIKNESPKIKFLGQKYFSAALVNKGYLCSIQSDFPESIAYYLKAMKIAEESKDTAGLANIYINIAFSYNELGDLAKALEYDFKGKVLAELTGDKKTLANSLNNIGFKYADLGDIPKALEYYEKSLKIREDMRDTSGIPESLNNIAGIYYSNNDYSSALKYYNQSLNLFKRILDYNGMAFCYNNIGAIFRIQGHSDSSLAYAYRALRLRELIGNKTSVAASCINIGGIYLANNNTDSALVFFKRARQINETINNKKGISSSLHNMAQVMRKTNKFNEALIYTNSALKLAQEIGYPELLRDVAYGNFIINEDLGNHKEALRMHKLFIVMRDSITNQENRKSVLKNQLQYEFGKKEAEVKANAKAEAEIINAKNNEEKKKQRIIIYSISLGLIITGIFAFLIFRSLQKNRKATTIIQEQKNQLESKQKEIVDSIKYAQRIQQSLMPTEKYFERNIKTKL